MKDASADLLYSDSATQASAYFKKGARINNELLDTAKDIAARFVDQTYTTENQDKDLLTIHSAAVRNCETLEIGLSYRLGIPEPVSTTDKYRNEIETAFKSRDEIKHILEVLKINTFTDEGK